MKNKKYYIKYPLIINELQKTIKNGWALKFNGAHVWGQVLSAMIS